MSFIFKFFHISDLHIGKNPMRTIHAERLIRRLEKQADGVPIICTGDQIENGCSIWQQDLAAHLMPVTNFITCPGNHDSGWFGLVKSKGVVPNYRRQVWSNNLVICVLDSMAGVTRLNRIGADGKLGTQQLMDLDGWLSLPKRTNQLTMVIMHHHPFFGGPFMRLSDADALKEIITDRIDILLFGHRHYKERLRKKEDKWKIPLIHSAGSGTELNEDGNLEGTEFSVDLKTKEVVENTVKVRSMQR